MTKGKIAAQCGHATLACYKTATRAAPNLVKRWETYGQTKIAVQCKGGEEELLELQARALSLGVVARVIHDAGRTQIAAGSATVLGLGPAPRSVVDQISGHLKLL
jgi:PTH2 family peptidyl-tRNA hydrolase